MLHSGTFLPSVYLFKFVHIHARVPELMLLNRPVLILIISSSKDFWLSCNFSIICPYIRMRASDRTAHFANASLQLYCYLKKYLWVPHVKNYCNGSKIYCH